jgi:AraC-like DNA-binding protein
MFAPPNAPLRAQLFAPRPSLSSCVRAYVTRSTCEAPIDDPAQRLNHFPSTPLASITFFIEGEAEMVEPPPPPGRVFVPVVLVGPQTRPTVTYNPGPVRVLMVMFYPQALHALCGIDMSTYVDDWRPLPEALDAHWGAMADAVRAAPDDDARIAVLEDFLDPLWRAARGNVGGATAADWVRHLGVQAAAAGWGRGVRNVERRIKVWAGQPMRTLRRMQRAEQSFFDARKGLADGNVSWADVAGRAGYADQSHFCRETREVTGLSPAEFARLVPDDESYWIYRIWT